VTFGSVDSASDHPWRHRIVFGRPQQLLIPQRAHRARPKRCDKPLFQRRPGRPEEPVKQI
jgi:hypothetical protein